MTDLTRTDNFVASLGVEAYRVGGSVRDELLGKRPKDADYVVRGVSLADLRDRLVRAGARVSRIVARDMAHLGWRAEAKGAGYMEIVLPRVERSSGEGRRQDIHVDYTLPLSEDAKRRDFTFNALYKDLQAGYDDFEIIDPTGRGMYDLSHRIVNTTHSDSFRDDPLRTLRALRFVSTLDYDLGSRAEAQMRVYADCVTGLTVKGHTSGTVVDEFSKLLMGVNPAKALRLARDTGVLAAIMPELEAMLGFEQGSRYHDMTTDEHVFTALETAAHVDAPLQVRWALLFHDAGKPEAAWRGKDGRLHYYAAKVVHEDGTPDTVTEDHEVIGERLWLTAAERLSGLSTQTRDEVAKLIRNHMVPCQKVNEVKVRRERVRLGDEMLRNLYLMRMCDLSGKGNKNGKFLANVAVMEHVRREAQEAQVPASIKELQINGDDVKALGVGGKRVGDVLRTVLDEVVCQPDERRLSREWQFTRATGLCGRS